MTRDGLAFALDQDVDLDERFDSDARVALQRGMNVQAYGVQVSTGSVSFAPGTGGSSTGRCRLHAAPEAGCGNLRCVKAHLLLADAAQPDGQGKIGTLGLGGR